MALHEHPHHGQIIVMPRPGVSGPSAHRVGSLRCDHSTGYRRQSKLGCPSNGIFMS